MVKKLLKHEAKYYSRTLIIYEIVLFSLAIFTRILMFFETDSIIYTLLQGSAFVLFSLAVFGCSLMATVISVYRFYKNLFSSEGYLTFALPVTTNQHIFTKLLSAFIYNIIVAVSSIIAFLITISGDILNEVIKAGVYILNNLNKTVPDIPWTTHIIFYIIELIIILLISTVFNLMLFYVCIAIGQTAKKNRILLSVAVYFAYITVSEIIGTIISIILSASVNLEFIQKIVIFFTEHPFATVHIAFSFAIFITSILSVVCYVVTHNIISRKLNLE